MELWRNYKLSVKKPRSTQITPFLWLFFHKIFSMIVRVGFVCNPALIFVMAILS